MSDSKILATTRSSGVTFTPPETHDMVRSLFDPRLKKSFLEVCISLTILANLVLAYCLVALKGLAFTKVFYLLQYVIWRIGYNLGIGILLHNQSHYESLTNYTKANKLFSKASESKLAKFVQFEIKSKMGSEYDMFAYPDEMNVWLLFRQFVDLILMQDFTTYIIYVALSLPKTWSSYINLRSFIGILMILFNIWVKIDAHRVVKDYAWYWGDFFFLQDSKLTFDGVFNISPHPMYSIGYLGYYGLSLITGDYKVLLVSIWGHFLQFLFLKYVESPHIDKTYGSDTEGISYHNNRIDDLITRENYDYSRPLIATGLPYFSNFQFLRFTDYFTVATVITLVGWYSFVSPTNTFMFTITLLIKLSTWAGISLILFQQSRRRWFTKLFLKNGYTQIYSYQQWQFLYNYQSVLTNVLLMLQTFGQSKSISSDSGRSRLIFGLLLVALHVWCNSEIRDAISDFGWFYGDFFLTNYITERKLTSQGIYRYLKNPEAILGVAGVWGTVLITDFSGYNIILASIWTMTNFIFVKFIEEPHVSRVYGNEIRISGVQKSLLALKPIRWLSKLVDDAGNSMIKQISGSSDSESDSESELPSSRKKLKGNLSKFSKTKIQLMPNSEFEIDHLGTDDTIILPTPITISWKLPSSLYNKEDWIGMYNVVETGTDRSFTKIPSLGHWSATNKDSFKNNHSYTNNLLSVTEFKESSGFASGSVTFDSSLLFYAPGIYEFRYHTKNSHKVLMISKPFKLSFPPSIDPPQSQLDIHKQMVEFVTKLGAALNGRFNENGNKYFSSKNLRLFIKESFNVDISTEYIRSVNGDLDVISRRIFEIKKILDELS